MTPLQLLLMLLLTVKILLCVPIGLSTVVLSAIVVPVLSFTFDVSSMFHFLAVVAVPDICGVVCALVSAILSGAVDAALTVLILCFPFGFHAVALPAIIAEVVAFAVDVITIVIFCCCLSS
jgi:hypothetical protein